MKFINGSQCGGRVRSSAVIKWLTGAVLVSPLLATPALSNGLGENYPWQFQTTQDKVNKGAIVDLIERKKGGFYDAYNPNITNNTYIDKQFNCSVTSGATGNAGSNGLTAATSSPTVSATDAINAASSGNSATNGLAQNGLPGILFAALNTEPSGALRNDQQNQGNLSSQVSGSSSGSSTGAISSDGGQTHQALNSTQSTSGYQTSTISGSTACNGPLAGMR